MNIPMVLAIIDVILCLTLIILVIVQEGHDKGLGVIGGGADTFFGKEKGKTLDGTLKKVTTFVAIAFATLTVVLFRILAMGGI